MSFRVEIPEPLRLRHRQTAESRNWLAQLPDFISQALQQWQLTVDLPASGSPSYGYTGVVIPVLAEDGSAAALKLAFPHDEAHLEPVALSLWDGHGAVRLLAHDKTLSALLLERLDDSRSLARLPVDDAVPVWGALVKSLSVGPDNRSQWQQIPQLAATAERYCDELPQRWSETAEPFPRWLLEAALEVCQTWGAVGRRSSSDVLVHTDLHYENVLGRPGTQEYWAIDPQVTLGHAEFALAPCLWNRLQDLPERNAEAGLRRRASQLSQAAGFDEVLAMQWTVVREVENALHYFEATANSADAQRSLWVASTMAGKTLPWLPRAHALKPIS